MAIRSFRDLKSQTLQSNFDYDYLAKLRLRDGATFDQLVREYAATMQALNAKLLQLPKFSALFNPFDSETVRYRIGDIGAVEEFTEYGKPVPQHSKSSGHMLPLRKYQAALGWTADYLRNARREELDNDFATTGQAIVDTFEKHLLERLFSADSIAVGNGKSLPFADGGASDPEYIPVTVDGKSFDATHNHYMGLSATGITDAAVEQMFANLHEHGHRAPFVLLISESDLGTWKTLTGWRKVQWSDYISYGTAEDRARLNGTDTWNGMYESDQYGVARVWTTHRLPSGYAALYKDYPAGSPKRPLLVRYDPAVYGWLWRLDSGIWVNMPTHLAVTMAAYGVGVGADRTAAVLADFNDATWVNPTIS